MIPGDLRVFYDVVRLGSIRKAAIEHGVAPSSVSRMIALLERQIGTSLFERKARGVEINHAGELVAAFARSVMLDYDSLKVDLDDYHGGRRALIRMAAVESTAGTGPASAIVEFHRKFPAVTFDLRMMPAPAVVEAVLAADVDIGVTFAAQPNSAILTTGQVREPLLLLWPREDDMVTDEAEPETVPLDRLSQYRLALPSTNFGVRQMLDQACAKANLALRPVLTSDSFETLRAFVVAGGGATVLPWRATLGRDNAKVCVAEIVDPRLHAKSIDVIVLKKRKLSRIMRLFIQQLNAQLAR